jgi:hypothetical protein
MYQTARRPMVMRPRMLTGAHRPLGDISGSVSDFLGGSDNVLYWLAGLGAVTFALGAWTRPKLSAARARSKAAKKAVDDKLGVGTVIALGVVGVIIGVGVGSQLNVQ